MTKNPVARARALVGCRFRAQGRSPELGLDCIGLIAATFDIPADSVPRDYRLRGHSRPRIHGAMLPWFRRVARPQARTGDIALFEVAADRLHLGLLTDSSFIHADAGLRQVVETPAPPPWRTLAVYRRRTRPARKA
jgi:murein DD-endopeptidase / murein LD-carboxypeptidase